jgi:hypothetical protein
MQIKNKIFTILACAFLLSACSLTGAPTPAPTEDIAPTLDAARTQAAQTVEAEIANRPTATALPATATLAPSSTPIPTNTPVPTNTLVIATNTPPPTNTPSAPTQSPTVTITSTPGEFGCVITASSPAQSDVFPLQADFDGRWTVKNTGTKAWAASEMDYRYVSGTKTYAHADLYDLPKDVAPGESIQIIVDMITPNAVGNFVTTWGINQGSRTICALPLYLTVKN